MLSVLRFLINFCILCAHCYNHVLKVETDFKFFVFEETIYVSSIFKWLLTSRLMAPKFLQFTSKCIDAVLLNFLNRTIKLIILIQHWWNEKVTKRDLLFIEGP